MKKKEKNTYSMLVKLCIMKNPTPTPKKYILISVKNQFRKKDVFNNSNKKKKATDLN